MTTKSQSLRLAEVTSLSSQDFRYVYTEGGFKICHRCCKSERNRFALDPLWIIKADNTNKTPYTLKCDHCGGNINPVPTKIKGYHYRNLGPSGQVCR